MPCSGLNRATSFTPGACASRSIVDSPVSATPVWLVTRPTFRPCSALKFPAFSTSMPLSTGVPAPLSRGAAPDAPKSPPVRRIVRRASAGGLVMAEPTTVAIFARSGVTSPLPSGWTRFERNTIQVFVSGSIHSDVPVHPVWPNEPSGISSPRLDE